VYSPRIEGAIELDDPVSDVKYVSGARQRALERLGIETVRDLLLYAPKRYLDFTHVTPISYCTVGERFTVRGRVDKVTVRSTRNRMKIIEAALVDETGVMNLVWFNQPWIADSVKKDAIVVAQGTVDHRYGFKQMDSPVHLVESAEVANAVQPVRPVYRQTKGLTTAWVARIVSEALEAIGEPVDPVPVRLRLSHGLMSRQSALHCLHQPKDVSEALAARKRLAYDELLALQVNWLREKRAAAHEGLGHAHVIDGPRMRGFLDSTPFALTDDQRAALDEILADMAEPSCMNRMLLGDVGTGKTIVACGAIAAAADSGSQSVLMAPTEVLASQYGTKIGPILESAGVSWAHLSSSTPASRRAEILAALASGELDVLFSTHAALESDVVFDNLSLVIIDEQHRFGVNQREKLRAKGEHCDYLCMTATPIPRSLALTIYGSLDCSYIRQRPGGNRAIETKVIDKQNRFMAYDEVRECVRAGHQAYIVCPLVGEKGKRTRESFFSSSDTDDEDERIDPVPLEEEDFAEIGEDLKAARQQAAYLQEAVFTDMRIGLMCGEMKPVEKDEAMEAFRRGETDVLVCTTVVEVGVDVPNATLIVVEDAEMFGLSQLHQLRGRVGRGEVPGKAILLASTQTDVAARRMAYIESTQDGFELAELDLSLRREGDIRGSRQHGKSALRFTNIVRDAGLIEQTRADASALLDADPDLEGDAYALLASELR
jgi:ATP-dependent DNA helicase RecG